MSAGDVQLGCGLIRIGRPWGAVSQEPIDAGAAQELLETALVLGIVCFDTAPAYGDSERVLGRFLRGLTAAERGRLCVATKVGEHWVAESGTTVVDHRVDAARRSIEQSLDRLGSIDVLQVHKASASLLASDELQPLLALASEYGIPRVGASVSDLAAFELARALRAFDVLQFPFNRLHDDFGPALDTLAYDRIVPFVNRPMAMGALDEPRASFGFVLRRMSEGVVLTGTADLDHLRENVAAFELARRDVADDGASR